MARAFPSGPPSSQPASPTGEPVRPATIEWDLMESPIPAQEGPSRIALWRSRLQAPQPRPLPPQGSARTLSRTPRWLWGVAALAVVGLVAFLVVRSLGDDGPSPITRADVDKAVQQGIAKAQAQQRNAPPDASAAYAAIQPSLVTVTADEAAVPEASSGATPGASPAPAPSAPAPSARPLETALGAGVVINADGSVLTALHVVTGATRIQVRFADGTTATATVTKQQPENDIAVLAVDRLPEVVVPAVIGGGAQVGDAVFPVGNPLGLQRSLSAGVVSALDRSIRTENGRTIAGLIQFDAAVNPGNSGGPLLNRAGQVIGVVTGLANPSKQPYFVGIGFAVPIATAGGVAGGPAK